MDDKYIDSLYLLIAGNQIEILVKELTNFNHTFLRDYKGKIAELAGRFNKIAEDRTLNYIDYKEYSVEHARVIQGFRLIIDELQKSGAPVRPATVPQPADPVFGKMEKIIGRDSERTPDDLKSMGWFDRLLQSARNVCQILVQEGGSMSTGFLIEGDWLVTNNHVLPTPEIAAQSIARFDFNEDQNGNIGQFQTVRISDRDFYTDQELNFTITRLEKTGEAELDAIRKLKIAANPPRPGDKVTLIHHPLGGPKKVDVQATILETLPGRTLYDGVTQPGSSGAPVFNPSFEVVGIHTGRDTQNIKYYIPIQLLSEALRKKGIQV